MSLLHFRFKERRRTMRVALAVKVTARWEDALGDKYFVNTHSLSVNREGGLLLTAEPLAVGQILHLVNDSTAKTAEAKVSPVNKGRDGKTIIGVEFLSPELNFWSMRFPVPGTRPLRRSVPSKVSA